MHRKVDQICGYQTWGVGRGGNEDSHEVQAASYKVNKC